MPSADEMLDRIASQLKTRANNCLKLAAKKPTKARAYRERRCDLLCALAFVRDTQLEALTVYSLPEKLPFIP
jgi:hypothetical protein